MFSLSVRSAPGGGSGGGGHPTGPTPADHYNVRVEHYLGWTWVVMFTAILVHRLVLYLTRYIRHIACMGSDKQRYFADTSPTYAAIKKHIINAPLFRYRHRREIRLSNAITIGCIPTRMQTFVIAAYIGINAALCTIHLPYSATRDEFANDLRNRSGVLSTMNVIPLFLFAGRNNPLIRMLDISYDTYNLMHRWVGRIVIVEALVHTLAWGVNKVLGSGWVAVSKSLAASSLIQTGTIGTIVFILIFIQSSNVLRHAYYEVFLHVHFLLALTFVVAIWMHLNTLPQQTLLLAGLVFWIVERLVRVYQIVRNNVGEGGTRAEIEAMAGDALRVTLHVARPWKFRPGQYVFLYIPSIGWWTSHPFSLAWSEEEQNTYSEKGLPFDRTDVLALRKATMSLVIRRRTGFTEKLWQKTEGSAFGKFTTSAIVEGPYGNQCLSSYGTVMLFAAGVGITHQVPHVRALVSGYANNTCAARRVVLVWIIQSPEHLEWIRPWMTDILSMEKRRDVLKILLFVTRPRSTKEIHSPSSSVQMYPGKPDVDALIAQEQAKQVGAMAVSVCGTGSLSDDVRRAVGQRCERTEMDFVENAFSW